MSDKPGTELRTAGTIPPSITLTKEDLKELLISVMQAANTMNPLEQKKYEEELMKEKRKAMLVKQLGEEEERQLALRRNSCSHCVDKSTGESVPRGQGMWITQGQVHSNDVISIVCLRCATVWYFKGTASERDYSINAEHGMLHFPPPSPERLLAEIAS